MFAVLSKYEERLERAELAQQECLRILEKLEAESDGVRAMVAQIVRCLDTLIQNIDGDRATGATGCVCCEEKVECS